MRDNDQAEPFLCIITGMSGAGKSTALRAFEDTGFFCIDGLPASLLPEMANMLRQPAMRNYRGVAIGMDLREPDFLESFNSALLELSARDIGISLIFLEASDAELLRRYAATRRPHPLERLGVGLAGAIEAERKALQGLKSMSDWSLDTSSWSIYDLRKAIRGHFLEADSQEAAPRINLISFGFKYGIPKDANFVFDLRFLPNPFFVEKLRPMCGKDAEVAEYVFASKGANDFVNRLQSLFDFILPLLQAEGRSRVTIALGCTGGRHRSVAVAEKVAARLAKDGYSLVLEHRNIESDIAAK